MKQFLKNLAICALAFFVGYGIYTAFSAFMKPNKTESGYVAASQIEVENGLMTPETLLAFGRISDAQISPDGKKMLYGVSYTSIENNKSCRNLFVSNLDGTNKVQLSRYAKSVSCARWSKDGKSIYFLQDGQLWRAAVGKKSLGAKRQISNIANGISEFKLSPDGTQVLYISTIAGPVKSPSDIDPSLDKANAYITDQLMYRHWDHWVTETPRSYVAPISDLDDAHSVDILGDEPFELPTEPFGGVEQLDWSPDGRYIAYSCRKKTGIEYAFSTNCGIYIYDVKTGKTIEVKTDGGYDTDPVWKKDGTMLAWLSMERDGYEADRTRILCAPFKAANSEEELPVIGSITELTAGFDNDASGLVWHGDEIYFCSYRPTATEAILKTDLKGNIIQLTAKEWAYDFSSIWAVKDTKEGVDIYANYCSLNFPTELVKISVPMETCKEESSCNKESSCAKNSACNGEISCKDKVADNCKAVTFTQITKENEYILSQLDEPTSESVYLETVDGKQMHCWVMYPPKFDASKKYPAIEIVLGGPQGTNSQGWSYRWCYRLMAQQGYIVIMPNRRGTTAFGQEWKEQISGDYPGLNMQDYLTAGRYIKSQKYVDKLACVGASYGGYSVYMLEGMHEDLYDCFIAHAGIFNEKQMWYTTEEMWFANWDNGGLSEYAYEAGMMGPKGDGITFGGMQQAGAPYASVLKTQRHYAKSPESMVTNWHTPILCIHGMMDFRIPYEQGMAAFNAAQMMGVPSRLVIFPEENHWILRPQNSLLWHKEFYAWLEKWCKN